VLDIGDPCHRLPFLFPGPARTDPWLGNMTTRRFPARIAGLFHDKNVLFLFSWNP
jgi:hypothetical protein